MNKQLKTYWAFKTTDNKVTVMLKNDTSRRGIDLAYTVDSVADIIEEINADSMKTARKQALKLFKEIK